MSVIVIGRFQADAGKMKELFESHKDDFMALHEQSLPLGAKHHQFVAGDNGEVLFIDEWDSRDGFQNFMQAQTKIPELMQQVGATGAPDISFYEVLDSPDKF